MSRPLNNIRENAQPLRRDAVAPYDLYRGLRLKIENLPIGEIKGYSRNARKHSTAQIEQIAGSMRSFGSSSRSPSKTTAC
jgi:hypothetical protein